VTIEATVDVWYYIAQFSKEYGWSRCLYEGKPSRFEWEEGARNALRDRVRYPRDANATYRIVKVIEIVQPLDEEK
jgi:hypothetical protein